MYQYFTQTQYRPSRKGQCSDTTVEKATVAVYQLYIQRKKSSLEKLIPPTMSYSYRFGKVRQKHSNLKGFSKSCWFALKDDPLKGNKLKTNTY